MIFCLCTTLLWRACICKTTRDSSSTKFCADMQQHISNAQKHAGSQRHDLDPMLPADRLNNEAQAFVTPSPHSEKIFGLEAETNQVYPFGSSCTSLTSATLCQDSNTGMQESTPPNRRRLAAKKLPKVNPWSFDLLRCCAAAYQREQCCIAALLTILF